MRAVGELGESGHQVIFEKGTNGGDISRSVHKKYGNMTRFVRRGMVFEMDMELDVNAMDVCALAAAAAAAEAEAEDAMQDDRGPGAEIDESTDGVPAVKARRSARDPTDQAREDHEICHEPYRCLLYTSDAADALLCLHSRGLRLSKQ